VRPGDAWPDDARPEDSDRPAEELRDIDAALRALEFTPRASLGPEIEGRLRRGEAPASAAVPSTTSLSRRRHSAGVAAAVLLTLGAGWVGLGARGELATMDHCCFDLDGGGVADDGVIVVTRGGERVRRLVVYEDRDGSSGFSAADTTRFARGATPALALPAGVGVFTTRHCCRDYDGGGAADDGLLIIAQAPERVLMAAIYETGGRRGPGAVASTPLR
jgi:hypothetical protein